MNRVSAWYIYSNVMSAVQRINDDLGIGMRHITVSTVGLPAKIRKLADINPQVLKNIYYAIEGDRRKAIVYQSSPLC